MKITLLTIGKTEDKYLLEGIDIYLKRLKHYIPFRILEIPELKNTKSLSRDQQKNKEAELLFKNIQSTD
jgi:23S rRNA (pseudouridine1915-N3)-methyltransferase